MSVFGELKSRVGKNRAAQAGEHRGLAGAGAPQGSAPLPGGFPQAPRATARLSSRRGAARTATAPSMHSLRRRTLRHRRAPQGPISARSSSSRPRHTSTAPGAPHTGSRGLLQAPHSGCPVPNPSPRSCNPAANTLITPSQVSKEKLSLRSSDTGWEHRQACSMGHRCSGSDLGFCGTSGKFINPSGHTFLIFKIGETNVLPSGVVGRFT